MAHADCRLHRARWNQNLRRLAEGPCGGAMDLAGAKMLREILNYSAVADMLNARGIPTGKYCRNKVWDRNLV